MVLKLVILLSHISKFMKVFMDIYGENCCQINNFKKQNLKFMHIFDLTLILRTLNLKYLHTLMKGKIEQM